MAIRIGALNPTDWHRRFDEALRLGEEQNASLKYAQGWKPKGELEGELESLRKELPDVVIDIIKEVVSDKVALPIYAEGIFIASKVLVDSMIESRNWAKKSQKTYESLVARLGSPESSVYDLRKQLKKAHAILELLLADDAPPWISEIYSQRPKIRKSYQRLLQTLGEVEAEDVQVLQRIKLGMPMRREDRFSHTLEKLDRLKLIEYSLSTNTGVRTDIRKATVTSFGDNILDTLTKFGQKTTF